MKKGSRAILSELKPFPFQVQAMRWLDTRNNAILALEQGLGKTIVSALDLKPPAVVVTTAGMKYRWEYELNRWRPDLKVQVIANRKTRLDFTADVWIINYDIIWKYALPLHVTLIVDECHRVKSPMAKRSQSVLTWASRAPRVRFLSGTPMVNRPIELFGILEVMNALPRRKNGEQISWKTYGRRFCSGWQTPWGNFDVSGASNLDELYEIVKPFMLRMTKEMVAPQLPPKTYRIIELEAGGPVKGEKAYLDFYKQNLRLPTHPIAFQSISDVRKLHAERKLPHAIEYIKDILDQNERKLVVFAHHRESVEGLVEALSAYGCVHAYGGMSSKAIFNNVQAFQEDSKVRVFVGNIQTAGEGISLTEASHVVFVEPSWVPGEIAQAADRCHRIVGTVRPVTIDLLTVQGSIDAKMLWNVLSKLEVIDRVIKETTLMDYKKIAELFRALADEFDIETEVEKPKKEKKEKKPAADVVEEEKDTMAEIAEEPVKEASLDDVRRVAAACIAAHKRDDVLELVSSFGAKKISDIDSSMYGEFVAKAKEILAS